MSNYVVIARFDEATDKKLLNLREKFENVGFCIQEWPPHITIAAYENIDEKLICDWAGEFSRNHDSFEIALNSLGVFPPNGDEGDSSVLFLAPAHSKTLVDFYYAFHSKHEEYCTGIGYYNSIMHGNPVIHCTLGVIDKDRLQKAINAVFESNVFTTAKITALELYTYPMKLIQRFELKKKGVKMEYTLRNCTYDDFELLFDLKKLCMKWYIEKIYGWNDEVQKTKTKNEINRNINDMKIIEIGGRGIGVTTFSKCDAYYRVGLIMIHPDYQNKGIGASIISDYIDTAKEDGKRIIIKTYKENPAKRLYERLGFSLYETDETHVHLEIDFRN